MMLTELERPDWRPFFERLAPLLRTHVVQVEVSGLGLEERIGADWVRLARLSYEPDADRIEVVVHGAERSIHAPARILVRRDEAGVHSIEIVDAQDSHDFVLLKEPLACEVPEPNEAEVLHERHARAEALRHGGAP